MFKYLKDKYLDFYAQKYRRQAHLTAQRIQEVSHTLTEYIEVKFRQRNHKDQPLFVMMGESHSQPAHRVARMMIVKKLQEHGHKIAVGKEIPYNIPEFISAKKKELNIGTIPFIEELFRSYIHGPQDDRENLEEFYEMIEIPFSDAAYRMEDCKLYHQDVPVSFNDAARVNGGNELDMQNALMQQIAGCGEQAKKEPVSFVSPEGVRVRNLFMMMRARQHARNFKPDIYMQNCGAAHVAGFRGRILDFSHEQSLTSLFSTQGQNVAGVVMLAEGFQEKQLPVADKSTVLAIHLEGASFSHSRSEKEKLWLQAVMPHIEGQNWNLRHALSFRN